MTLPNNMSGTEWSAFSDSIYYMGTHEKQSGYGRRLAVMAGAAALALGCLSACSSEGAAPVPHGYSEVDGVGGSYAAGIEAGPPIAGMPEQCEQSEDAFPRQVAAELGGLPVHNYACSGATTEDVLGESGSNRQPAQLAERAMRGALVIVFVGGNDVGWMQYLKHCARRGCAKLPAGADGSRRYQRVTQNIETIVEMAYDNGAREVLVNGYVNPAGKNRRKLGCLQELGLTPHRMTNRDYQRMGRALWLLNNALETGVNNARQAGPEYAGAKFVPLKKFDDHGICEPKLVSDGPMGYESGPWIVGPHHFNGGAPWHPNGAGQHAIALADLQAAQPK